MAGNWTRKRDCTIPQVLSALASERANQEALVYPFRDLRWDFADLERRTMQAARAALALGIDRGDRITVWAENIPEWIVLQFALARIGVVLVTANTALKPPEIEYLLRQSESCGVFFSAGMEGNSYPAAIEEKRAALPDLKHEVFLGAREAAPGAPSLAWDDFLAGADDVPADRVREIESALDPDDVINMQYTSGTTGFPKGVMLTHRNLVNNAWGLGECLSYAAGERLALTLPLFHCFGCVVGSLGAYVSAVTICAVDRFDGRAAVELIERERCNIIYGVPTHFRLMLEAFDDGDFDVTSLRTGIMGGAPCPEELVKRLITDFHVPEMVAAYGLTECSPGVSTNDPHDSLERRCTTVGRPLDEIEVRIVDPASGKVVPTGGKGELHVRGHCVMKGYYKKPEETAEVLSADGWLRTGDLAVQDEDGYLQIVGRLKEVIIRGGENVYPAEVEDVLRGHEAVRDAAVFGVPCEKFGEEVHAAILVTEGREPPDEKELRDWLKERVSGIKVPTRMHIVDAYPMTASGKVQKFALVEHFGPKQS